MEMRRVQVIDSHTEGEPTRVILEGAPNLYGETLAAQSEDLSANHAKFLRAVLSEPRGYEAIVGALLVEPRLKEADAGVIFFNNVGTLGMCGHGTIGLVRTLQHLGKLGSDQALIDTPAGPVKTKIRADGRIAVRNVPSRLVERDVAVKVEGAQVVGDIAYGGNWFFLTPSPFPLTLEWKEELTRYSVAVRRALNETAWEHVDHVALIGDAQDPANDARNFVLCPGLEYDRSPCGTGTSAKVATLAARGRLKPGEVWRQESVIGSVFEASYEVEGDLIVPTIAGRAFITAESSLIYEDEDPLH
jgi:4-hydroxyproline epimerase